MTFDSEMGASATKADRDSIGLLAIGFCWLGIAVFVVSLFLPSVEIFGPMVGYYCLMFGFYWWPSNLTLLFSPSLCRMHKLWIPLTALVVVSLTLIVNVAIGINESHGIFVRFWMWTIAYALVAVGLAVRVTSMMCRVVPPVHGLSLSTGSSASLESGARDDSVKEE